MQSHYVRLRAALTASLMLAATAAATTCFQLLLAAVLLGSSAQAKSPSDKDFEVACAITIGAAVRPGDVIASNACMGKTGFSDSLVGLFIPWHSGSPLYPSECNRGISSVIHPEASIRVALRDVRCPRCNGYGRPRIVGPAPHPSI
jgi:hypothetical protein